MGISLAAVISSNSQGNACLAVFFASGVRCKNWTKSAPLSVIKDMGAVEP